MSIYDSTFILVYGIVVAFILGACLGSFLNCAAIRVCREESFVKGRSHCMHCGHDLAARDLIPILSWVLLRGKCRYCGGKVSGRYPLAEVIFALVCVCCLLKFDLTVEALRNFVFLAVLFFLTLTDLEEMIIPDRCHIIAALAWAAAAPVLYTVPQIISHVAAGLVFGGGILVLSLVMDKVLGRDSMGGGDIKLLAVAGLYFGFIGTLFVLVLACVVGLVVHVLRSRGEAGKAFPFGPSIAIACGLVLFIGQPLIDWYASLMG